MDVLWFLKRRTTFIRKYYTSTSAQYIAEKRKIEAGEPPYDQRPPGFDPEYGEPPFLEEYQDADEALEFLGQSSISFLSASFQLFLNSTRGEIESAFHRIKLPPFDDKYAKKNGLLRGYAKWFGELHIDMAQSDADLDVIEQVVLTRNLAQHPEFIGSMTLTFRGKQRHRFPRPFFAHPIEAAVVSPDVGAGFPWMLSITPKRFLQAVDEVDKLCEFLDDGRLNLGRPKGESPDGKKPERSM